MVEFRILVVGSMGSGKTTLATRLAGQLGVACHHMDAYFFTGADWSHRTAEQLAALVAERIGGARQWVVDGNSLLPGVAAQLWPAATHVVWLDVAAAVALWRLLWRSVWRVATRAELFGVAGLRETLWNHFTANGVFVPWFAQRRKLAKRIPELRDEFVRPDAVFYHVRSARDLENVVRELVRLRDREYCVNTQ
ncbi:hypothetical protein BDR26DRAFT_864889 [Obelidium mucronatum]|nr:hypothetical protein BDR26DRAFT_864889 [Obelidium mucronatum]